MSLIDSADFTAVVSKLREFFTKKGFMEVHTQNRLSILAACEDPNTIATYNYAGEIYPLPQTGQMWLEYEMLKYPERAPGYFCVSTSYRQEPNPQPGRHEIIFPMFEFEIKGGMEELVKMEKELLVFLGFGDESKMKEVDYRETAKKYNVPQLENEHEGMLCDEYGPVVFLENFPVETSPFWNMKMYENDPNTSRKVDVLMWGMETIGSAQRSTDKQQMRDQFLNISEKQYSEKLFSLFGAPRVQKELDEFLEFDFFERSGGGIGMTRLIRAMKLSKLI
jgi:aspartyl/asparaginyl-tRNA synthetase